MGYDSPIVSDSTDPFKNDDRYLAGGLLLVVVENRHLFCLAVEKPLAFRAGGSRGAGLKALTTHFDIHGGSGGQGVVPPRVLRRTSATGCQFLGMTGSSSRRYFPAEQSGHRQ